jgi:DNA-binding GntR family transcriptional regulator
MSQGGFRELVSHRRTYEISEVTTGQPKMGWRSSRPQPFIDADVTARLRTEIVSGKYSPNERLTEFELVDRYGVSRGAIRTAIVELTKEGLITRTPNRGARVRLLSPAEVIEVTEARIALEGLCAASAAERASEDEIESLRSAFEAMRSAVRVRNIPAFSQALHLFHHHVRDFSHQLVAAQAAEQLRNQGIRQLPVEELVPYRLEESLLEHEAIFTAIANHRSDEAEAAMRLHRIGATKALLELQKLESSMFEAYSE